MKLEFRAVPPEGAPSGTHAANDGYAGDRSELLELLSDRLLADFPAHVWRKAFLGPGYDAIRFERGVVTFVCTGPLAPDWTESEITTLAGRLAGSTEMFGERALFAFRDPRRALEFALLLQRGSDAGLRIVLMDATTVIARFEVDGCERSLTLGPETASAAASLGLAPPRTIYISGGTYQLLGSTLERKSHEALLTTEIVDGVVRWAEITLPPRRQDAMSTFAGLGLTQP